MVGDQMRLRQVLANLLTNVLTHTPGMPPDVLVKVFDRFYRDSPARTRDHGGSGLGLSILESLTEARGGTVCCTSSVAGGSTFVASLPLAPEST